HWRLRPPRAGSVLEVALFDADVQVRDVGGAEVVEDPVRVHLPLFAPHAEVGPDALGPPAVLAVRGPDLARQSVVAQVEQVVGVLPRAPQRSGAQADAGADDVRRGVEADLAGAAPGEVVGTGAARRGRRLVGQRDAFARVVDRVPDHDAPRLARELRLDRILHPALPGIDGRGGGTGGQRRGGQQ